MTLGREEPKSFYYFIKQKKKRKENDVFPAWYTWTQISMLTASAHHSDYIRNCICK